MDEIIFHVEEDPEDGYVAKAMNESIFRQADTLEALKESLRDAVDCYFSDRRSRPKWIRLHIVRDEVIAL